VRVAQSGVVLRVRVEPVSEGPPLIVVSARGPRPEIVPVFVAGAGGAVLGVVGAFAIERRRAGRESLRDLAELLRLWIVERAEERPT
jgi:hypothetical protein